MRSHGGDFAHLAGAALAPLDPPPMSRGAIAASWAAAMAPFVPAELRSTAASPPAREGRIAASWTRAFEAGGVMDPSPISCPTRAPGVLPAFRPAGAKIKGFS